MKMLFIITCTLVAGQVYASSNQRKPSSEIDTGSYLCENSEKETVGNFYVRADGTSKKVEIISAKPEQDGREPEGCFSVTFKWIQSKMSKTLPAVPLA